MGKFLKDKSLLETGIFTGQNAPANLPWSVVRVRADRYAVTAHLIEAALAD